MNPTHPPTRFERIQEKLAHSREWSISLAIHGVIVAALSTFVLVKATQEEKAEFTLESSIPSDLPTSLPSPQSGEERPNIEITERRLAETPATPPSLPSGPSLPNSQPLKDVLVGVNGKTFTVPVDGIPDRIVPILSDGIVPKEMRQRFQKDAGNRIVMKGGGGKPIPNIETENAVLRGLNWLRDNQNGDGSWGHRHKGAMTGLALLAFLGHGETGNSESYGLNVNRAVDWIIENGTASQSRLSMTKDGWGPGNGGVYEHGILTYALGEYYNLSRDERVEELYRKAIEHIVAGQGPDGGWMYHYDKTQSDTSVSGWQVQALKAAHLTKMGIPGVDKALDRAMENFDRVQGPNGGYGYRTPGDRYSLSGVGLACELFWNGKRDNDMRKGVKFILDQTKSEPIQYEHGKADLYAWYYHTQAMLMYGGQAWIEWEGQFRPMAIKSQSHDGSWPAMKAVAHGNLQTDTTVTGGVYRTTLSVIMLESYYRYLHLNHANFGASSSNLAVW